MPDSPFARYLRQIDSRLRMLPLAQRELIRRELTAHLEDAATEQQVETSTCCSNTPLPPQRSSSHSWRRPARRWSQTATARRDPTWCRPPSTAASPNPTIVG